MFIFRRAIDVVLLYGFYSNEGFLFLSCARIYANCLRTAVMDMGTEGMVTSRCRTIPIISDVVLANVCVTDYYSRTDNTKYLIFLAQFPQASVVRLLKFTLFSAAVNAAFAFKWQGRKGGTWIRSSIPRYVNMHWIIPELSLSSVEQKDSKVLDITTSVGSRCTKYDGSKPAVTAVVQARSNSFVRSE